MSDKPAPAIRDLWHVISAAEDVPAERPGGTLLFGERVAFQRKAGGTVSVWRASAPETPLPTIERYGFLWASFGTPGLDLFAIPEYAESDRVNTSAGSIGVNVSAPRAIENFLDMSHFPYVHTGILGAEPRTEVKDYDVEISADGSEILATRCRFYQPRAALSAGSGLEVEYVYRVPHPYCSVLYKSSPTDTRRMDVIALFCQPMDEETVRAHMMLSLVDETNSLTAIRRFQQIIFGQDRPILENQFPKRLPLDPRAETPIRADKTSIVYRRWLAAQGVDYGVIRADEGVAA